MEKQTEQHQKWWQKNNNLLMRIVLIALLVVVIALIILIILGYILNWDWTGLNATDFTTTPQNVTKTIAYQPAKTLWDWLQLLIIPAVLAVAGYVINLTISRGEQAATEQRAKSEREAAEKRAETERDIAQDNQCEAALQEYIDKMSDLMLHEDLRNSKEDAEVRTIARVRTLTVLPRLDGIRKGSVIQFLYESSLINKDSRIIDLSYADFSSVNLVYFTLSGANLSKVNLRKSNLFHANLCGTDLHLATLTSANLFEANLSGANLEKAFLDGGADLGFTDLRGANLRGAILKGTNLRGTKLITFEQLEEASFYEGVIMPDGSIRP